MLRKAGAVTSLAATFGGVGLYFLRRQQRRAFSSSRASRVTYETLDVFTTKRFGGNQLAVVYDPEERLNEQDMQSLAAEFGFSETTFVLPPRDPDNTAWVRIFSPTAEMPFAGHPNVGTATAIAMRGELFGQAVSGQVRLEEKAGIVPLDILLDSSGSPGGAMLTAPEPFTLPIEQLPVDVVASCIGLDAEKIDVSQHPPCVATTGLPFIVVEVKSLDALNHSCGVPAAFADARSPGGVLASAPPKVLAYVRVGGGSDKVQIRCRMHRADGTEDAGTGGANCALIGLLASLNTTESVVKASILQGVEMGRPSELHAEADRQGTSAGATAVGAVRIGGHCVLVSHGELVGWD